jgi:hypothetical protein
MRAYTHWREPTRTGNPALATPRVKASSCTEVGDMSRLTWEQRSKSLVTSDGTQTVEDTEERNRAAASDPLRLVRRIVTTERKT